jgi:hypothetical protein
MAIEFNGPPEQLQTFANKMDAHCEEMTGFITAITGAQQTYGGAVARSGTATSIQLAFEDAKSKAGTLRGRLLLAEDAMRRAGAKINDADDEAQAQVHAAAYAF